MLISLIFKEVLKIKTKTPVENWETELSRVCKKKKKKNRQASPEHEKYFQFSLHHNKKNKGLSSAKFPKV